MSIETAVVRMHESIAGVLIRNGAEYVFAYEPEYIANGGMPLSASLPLQDEPFISDTLFPYFDGLAAEGWLKEVQSRYQKIDAGDRFSLLIENGENLAGAITIAPMAQDVIEALFGQEAL